METDFNKHENLHKNQCVHFSNLKDQKVEIETLAPRTTDARWSLFFAIISLPQTNWAFGVFSVLFCPWENGFGCFFLQKFLVFKEIYSKFPNMVLAVKNLRSSHHTSVVSVWSHFWLATLQPTKFTPYFGLTSESRLNGLGLYFPPIYLHLIFDIL